ncbi:MAG: MFS transporter [Methylocystis sp.]|jgi:sugar phosphate permease|nr:MFS transporter [Methylocystis sp.]
MHTITPTRADPFIWAVLAVAVGTQAAGSIVSQGVYILVPFWRDAFGVSLATASLAVTVMNGTQILTMFSLGRAIDRFGERVVVGIAMLGMGAAMAAAAMAPSLPLLLVCMALMGGVYAAVQPGGTRAIMRWFPPQHRGIATGFRQAAVPFGTAIAAAALPIIAAAHGWQAAVGLQAVVALAGALLFLTLYREGGAATTSTGGALPVRQLIPQLGQDRDFWPVLRAGIAMSAFQFTLTAHAIGYMADSLQLGIAVAASLFATAQLLGIPGRVLLPWASDTLFPGRRVRSLGAVMLLGALAAIALLSLSPGDATWMLVCVLIAIGLFGIGWFPLYILQVAEMAPKSSIASTVSFATTLCMIVMALGPFVFGLIVDLAGYRMAWLLLTAPVVLTALPLLVSARRTVAA